MKRCCGAVLFVLTLLPVLAQAQTSSLNLSRDLVSLGISTTNMTPDQPTLDAGPLFIAGANYAKNNGVSLVTVDPGSYYFQTLQFTDRHVSLSGMNSITFDFQGSTFYLGRVQRIGIALLDSNNTVFKNVSFDFSQLPFTQVSVVSRDTSQRSVQFQVPAGWQHPSAFSTPLNASGNAELVYVFIFRNGQPVQGISRLQAQRPFTGDQFNVVDEGTPWTAADVLARIQPGDTAVLTARGVGEPLRVQRGDGVTIQNVKVFSSGCVGVVIDESARTLVERVYVMPKPDTDRLISSNCDGITFSQPGEGNTVRLSRSIRTLDDGFSPHSLIYGTVTQKPSARRLTIQRQHSIRIANNVPVVFQSRADGQILGAAIVVAQDPAETQTPVANGTVQVDFDQDLPDLPAGTAVYSSEPSQRANNTTVERNAVQDQVFARGISLWGLVNSTVRGNYISGSHMAGIFGIHRLFTADWMSPPLESVTITNNVIDGTITNMGQGPISKMAGIQLLAQKSDQNVMLVSPHKGIQVANNFVGESARSGIRIENVASGAINANILVDPNINPYIDGYFQDTFEPYKTEFRQPLVLKTSTGVTNTNNVIENGATRIAVTDSSSRRLSAYAPAANVRLNAIGIDSLAAPAVTMTDADGISHPVAIVSRNFNIITVQLPPATALGGAVINVTSGTTIMRGTLFVDSQDNFALSSKSWTAVPVSLNGAGSTSTVGEPTILKAGYATASVITGSTPYATAVFSLMSNNVVVTEAAVPTAPPTTLTRVFIDYRTQHASQRFTTNTGIAMVNTGTASANVTYTLRNTTGAVLSIGHGSLARGAHVSKYISDLRDIAPDFAVPLNFQDQERFGSLDIASTQPLSVVAVRLTTNQRDDTLLTTTPTVDLTRTPNSETRYFPQFADGKGWYTTIVLMNTSTATETGKINVYADNNNSDASITYSIAPGGVYVFESKTERTPVGSAQVVPDANTFSPIGAGVFSYYQGNRIIAESGTPSATLTTHALIYVDLSTGHNTGLALAAPSTAGVTLTLKAFEKNGTTVAGTSLGPVTLAANSQKAAFVGEFISGLPTGFKGVLDISSTTPFAALTIRSLVNADNDFLLTTFPVADANQDAPAPIIFPQIVEGGGFSTEFILLSPRGASNTAIYFYDDFGTPLAIGR